MELLLQRQSLIGKSRLHTREAKWTNRIISCSDSEIRYPNRQDRVDRRGVTIVGLLGGISPSHTPINLLVVEAVDEGKGGGFETYCTSRSISNR